MAKRIVLDIPDEKYQEVIEYLHNGGTKKEACNMLNIAYNTKRLDKLLVDYVEGQARAKRIRAERRKQPVTQAELVSYIEDALSGVAIGTIAEDNFRSTGMVKYHLEKAGANIRQQSVNELDPPMLPDECIAEEFAVGQYVWSAKYNSIAKVCSRFSEDVYRIKVINESMNQYAYQPYWELGSLEHLIALGVNVKGLIKGAMDDDEIMLQINEALRAANKRKS